MQRVLVFTLGSFVCLLTQSAEAGAPGGIFRNLGLGWGPGYHAAPGPLHDPWAPPLLHGAWPANGFGDECLPAGADDFGWAPARFAPQAYTPAARQIMPEAAPQPLEVPLPSPTPDAE